jgi:hypothetical protein
MNFKTKYALRVLAGMAGYALGLFALNALYSDSLKDRYWLILLPVLPLVYVAATIVRYASELDEMWRKVLTEAMAFSGVATGFTCFSYLFFRDMGAREFHAEWAFYLMWVYYAVGAFFSYWRYR